MKSKKPAADKFQLVTDKMIALLETGVKPWEKPWYSSPYQNAVSGHNYGGMNPLLCRIDCMSNGYTSPFFCGFQQAKEAGWKLRKGSKATWLIFGGRVAKETTDDQGETRKEWYSMFKWVQVFNLDCMDTSEGRAVPEIQHHQIGNIPLADELVNGQRATIQHGGTEAYYRSSTDTVQMPNRDTFKSTEGYYATLIHELSHWTGHTSRLDRQLGNRFGSEAYAAEELIAELSTAFVCSDLGIDSTLENHASYIDSWLRVLKNDGKAFIKAASAGQVAARWLWSNADIAAAADDAIA